jgi:hypothetical protein
MDLHAREPETETADLVAEKGTDRHDPALLKRAD